MSWLGVRCIRAAATGFAVSLALWTVGQPALAEDEVYTVAAYPVDAVASDAVTAKQKALAEGQQAAFRSLLKRLVPVTAYDQLERLKQVDAHELIEGVSVRDERTSATQYIASLDFSFRPEPIRDLLRSEGVPFVDEQAPAVTMIPIYLPAAAGQGSAPAALSPARGSRMWREVWSGLDLKHALTPITLGDAKAELTAEVIQQLVDGDGSALGTLSKAYGSSLVILAVAQPDLAAKRLNVALTGRDAVGAFVLKRSYRLSLDDPLYTGELAAVIALGILEGRWKATKFDNGTVSAGFGGALIPVQMIVEFRNLRQWQQMQQRITMLPGLEGMQVGGLSARGADVTVMYPGGPEALAQALTAQGFGVRQFGSTLQVSPSL